MYIKQDVWIIKILLVLMQIFEGSKCTISSRSKESNKTPQRELPRSSRVRDRLTRVSQYGFFLHAREPTRRDDEHATISCHIPRLGFQRAGFHRVEYEWPSRRRGYTVVDLLTSCRRRRRRRRAAVVLRPCDRYVTDWHTTTTDRKCPMCAPAAAYLSRRERLSC